MKNKFLALKDNIENSQKLYLEFSLSGRSYAVLAESILEIIQIPAMLFIEKLPENLIGLINLRGKVISVVDIRKLLGINIETYSIDHQILIINIGGHKVGIIADSVNNVIPIEDLRLDTLPYETTKGYIKNIFNDAEKIISILNLNAIVNEIELLNPSLNMDAEVQNKLLPIDEISVQKLNKRALNLQKEIRVDIDKNYFIKDKFVSFSLHNEIYCLSLKYVKEFTKLKNIKLTPVPCVPSFIAGLVNLRGDFITIIDIKYFLQISKTQITDKTKIIVIKTEDLQIGLLVDEVFDIVSIPIEKLKAETISSFEKENFTIGEVILENKKVMNILNLERLLSDERLYFEDAV